MSEEKRIKQKQCYDNYVEKHKDRIKTIQCSASYRYYERHKEEILEKRRQYYLEHKEELLKKKKEKKKYYSTQTRHKKVLNLNNENVINTRDVVYRGAEPIYMKDQNITDFINTKS